MERFAPPDGSKRKPRSRRGSSGRQSPRSWRVSNERFQHAVETIELTRAQVNHLIGERGKSVERMRKATGAKISYAKAESGKSMTGTISGSQAQVDAAMEQIREALDAFTAQDPKRPTPASVRISLTPGVGRFLSSASGSEVITAARRRFSVDVSVSTKENVISISGKHAGLAPAKAFLLERLNNLVAISVPVPGWSVGRIIGRRGEGLARITQARARVADDDDDAVDPGKACVYFPDTSLKLATAIIAGDAGAVADAHNKVIQTLSSVMEQAGMMLFVVAPPEGKRLCLRQISPTSVHGSAFLARVASYAPPDSPARSGATSPTSPASPVGPTSPNSKRALDSLFPLDERTQFDAVSLPTSAPRTPKPHDAADGQMISFDDLEKKLQTLSTHANTKEKACAETTTFGVARPFFASSASPLYSPLPSRPVSPKRGRGGEFVISPGAAPEHRPRPVHLPFTLAYCDAPAPIPEGAPGPSRKQENVLVFGDAGKIPVFAPPELGGSAMRCLYGGGSALTVDRRFAVSMPPRDTPDTSEDFLASLLLHNLAALSAQFGYTRSPKHSLSPAPTSEEALLSLASALGPLTVSVYPGKISFTPKSGSRGGSLMRDIDSPEAFSSALRRRKLATRFLMGVSADRANRLVGDEHLFDATPVASEHTDMYYLWHSSVFVPVQTLAASKAVRRQVRAALPDAEDVHAAPSVAPKTFGARAPPNPVWNCAIVEKPVETALHPTSSADLRALRDVVGADSGRVFIQTRSHSLCLYVPSGDEGYDLLVVLRPAGPAGAQAPQTSSPVFGQDSTNALDEFTEKFAQVPSSCSFATPRGSGASGLLVAALPIPQTAPRQPQAQIGEILAGGDKARRARVMQTQARLVTDSEHAALVQMRSRVVALPRDDGSTARLSITASELVDFREEPQALNPRIKKQVVFSRPAGFAFDGPAGAGRAPLPLTLAELSTRARVAAAAAEVAALVADARRLTRRFLDAPE